MALFGIELRCRPCLLATGVWLDTLLTTLLDHCCRNVLCTLLELQRRGAVERVGVSCYAPEEALALLRDPRVQHIQLPFNLLDARGVISVTERAAYIGRVRALARGCCEAWIGAAKAGEVN